MKKVIRLEDMPYRGPPAKITELLKKELGIKNIFMVVGKPGSGKSTFLRIIKEIDPSAYCIDTDKYSQTLRPILEQRFADADLVDIAIDRPADLVETIAAYWLEMAAGSLINAPDGAAVFIEVPYGLRPEYAMFRYFGANVIYIGNENPDQSETRIRARGNPQTIRFLKVIPGKDETARIAAANGLTVTYIDTSKTIGNLRSTAIGFLKNIK